MVHISEKLKFRRNTVLLNILCYFNQHLLYKSGKNCLKIPDNNNEIT